MQNEKNTWRGQTQETKNAVNKNRCHSRVFLSGIFNACRYNKTGKSLLNKYVEDPRVLRTAKSGMTHQNNRHAEVPLLSISSALTTQDRDPEQKRFRMTLCKGFTLIELLVVVLIIGLLAAVALPQYNKAVHKAQGTEALYIVDVLDKALQDYYLTHSTYEGASLDTLNISFPKELKYFKWQVGTGPDGTWALDNLRYPFQLGSSPVGIYLKENSDNVSDISIFPSGNKDTKWECKSTVYVNHGTYVPKVTCADLFPCEPLVVDKKPWGQINITEPTCYIK